MNPQNPKPSTTSAACGLCRGKFPAYVLRRDNDISAWVCPQCRRNLMIAGHALDQSQIRGIHRGPFSGTSNG